MADIGYWAWELAGERRSAPCIRDDSQELTYEQFANRVQACAAQLAEAGLGRGDLLAVMLPNRVELVVAIMAAWRLGAAATPLNPTFTETEAEYQIIDSGACLVLNSGPSAPSGGRPALSVDDLRTEPDPAWTGSLTPAAEDLALLIYTSGSTGRPKGVMLTHANLHFMASSMVSVCSISAADHCLLILPLFHVNAICVSVLAPMIAGAQVSITGRFSLERFFADAARLRPTFFSAVPTIYAFLVAHAAEHEVDTSSLRFAVCGAAPISKELLTRAEERFGMVIVEGYGLTEGTCASTCNPVVGVRKVGTVGPALPGQRVAVMDKEGNLLPVGEPGEVVISGPNVMRGYLGKPEETVRAVIDGWLHTGDVGFLDEDGYLTLIDRIKDMVIRGGENIYPKEIENALATHPTVLESAVIGSPDQIYGEVPVAYVVTYPNTDVTGEILREHLAGILTKIKLPVAIDLVEQLPRNPVGKIDKPALRRALRDKHTV